MNQPADESSITKPTVVQGMGYPNNRKEESPTPIGWQGLQLGEVEHVSRETSGTKDGD